jgi:hypothetical protein
MRDTVKKALESHDDRVFTWLMVSGEAVEFVTDDEGLAILAEHDPSLKPDFVGKAINGIRYRVSTYASEYCAYELAQFMQTCLKEV